MDGSQRKAEQRRRRTLTRLPLHHLRLLSSLLSSSLRIFPRLLSSLMSLVIVAPGARRVTVKTTPNSSLQEVRESDPQSQCP